MRAKNLGRIAGGLTLATTLLTGGVAYAQTGSTTPAVPNTGAGGNATVNTLLLGVSALAVIAGGAYLTRKKIPQ